MQNAGFGCCNVTYFKGSADGEIKLALLFIIYIKKYITGTSDIEMYNSNFQVQQPLTISRCRTLGRRARGRIMVAGISGLNSHINLTAQKFIE